MSQIYKTVASGPIPPEIPIEFDTQVNSPAIPAANILIVNGGSTTSNVDNGIQSDGSSGSNTLTMQLTNRQTATVSTSDGTLTTILTFAMGATPGTFYVYGNVQAFNSTTPASGGYSYSGGYRTDGATGVELGTEFHDDFEDPALAASDIFLSVSGNNVILQVQGVAGLNINWNSLLEFRKVV